MKNKLLFISFIIVISIMITSCFQSKESKACDQLILDIGEVTFYSQIKIQEAETAYNALSEKDKETLKNYDILRDARNTYNRIVIENQASEVMALINSIGIVTMYSGDIIAKARYTYNTQSEEVKKLVTNADLITEAENRYLELRVKNVNDLIDSIVIQKTGIKFQNSLKEALDAYKNLTYKEQITCNWNKLKDALSQYKQIKKSNKSKLKQNHDPVKQRTFYSSWSAPENYKESFICPYISAKDGGSEVLIIEYNYHSNNWVFFNKVNLLIDDTDRYEISCPNPKTEVVRYNGGIFEYDELVGFSKDIDMLWKIVDSKKTLVRYTGRNYYDDFYINNNCRWAIQQVLDAYDDLEEYYILFGL